MAPSSMQASCSKDIISSHTISRSAALAKIARDGHVYSTNPSFKQLSANGGRLVPELIGTRRMSTFNGFCGAHDNDLFKLLDDPVSLINAEFCTQLAFRSLSKELFLKQELPNSDANIRLLERGRSKEEQESIRLMLSAQRDGMAAAERDLIATRDTLEKVLVGGDTTTWKHTVFILDGSCPIIVSSIFQPITMPDGTHLQNLADLETSTENVVYGSVPTSTGCAFVLSALRESSLAQKFIGAICALDTGLLPAYLVGLSFEMCENVAISPDWWEGLPKQWSETLVDAINRGVSPFGAMSSEANPLRLGAMPVKCVLKSIHEF